MQCNSLCGIKEVNDGLGIKSRPDFVQYVDDGHNAFVHPLKSDKLLISHFLCFYNKLNFHIFSTDGKCSGYHLVS